MVSKAESVPSRTHASRLALLFSLIILGGLVCFFGYLMFQQLSHPETLVSVAKQEVVQIGNQTNTGFRITNKEGKDLNYTYTVSLKLPVIGAYSYSDTILIPNGGSFEFVLYATPAEKGVIVVTIKIYKGNEMFLIEDITYYISVE